MHASIAADGVVSDDTEGEADRRLKIKMENFGGPIYWLLFRRAMAVCRAQNDDCWQKWQFVVAQKMANFVAIDTIVAGLERLANLHRID